MPADPAVSPIHSTAPGDTAPEEAEAPEGAGALRRAVWSAEALAAQLPVDAAAVARVARHNRLRIPLHYLVRIQAPGDPLWRQAVPDAAELEAELGAAGPADFLAEDDPAYSPVPHLTHRYPDRVLLLVTDLCPLFCRFCMRKRKTLRGAQITTGTIERGIAYVWRTPAVREVILSGGDPLMLPDRLLGRIVARLRAIPHVRVVRIHTRMPAAEPARVTDALARRLAARPNGGAPVVLAAHVNHPHELSPEAAAALGRLRRAGIPLLSQSVLLRGVNDDPAVLAALYRRLLRLGVHPYYLHHSDQVPGSDPFRVPVAEGRRIVAALRAQMPELAVLHYVLDTPGGGGKVPLG